MSFFTYFNRQYCDLLLAMTEKEIKARYKKAVFGFLWMILNPLLQMLVIGFVFQYVTRIPIDNYFVFLFVGLLPWNFFSMTVLKNVPMYVNERNLIQKAKFPRETIVLSIVLANMFHMIISLALLISIVFFLGSLHILYVWLLPFILCWLLLLVGGLSLLLSSLHIKYRDVNFITQVVIPLWFYATPVMYTLDFVPGNLRNWFYLNPMTGIVELCRWVLLGSVITLPSMLWLSMGVSVIIIVLGVYVFYKESPFFVDWV